LAALATSTPCQSGNETHVASLIADLMRTKVADLARAHPARSPEFALST
jgi:hypothetical protein